MTDTVPVLDLTFLRAQTFGDVALERDVLRLFLAQGRDLLPHLIDLSPADQTATAHLLKGSCQSLGAVALAEALEHFGLLDHDARRRLGPELLDSFHVLAAAIEARLDAL